MRIDFHRHFDRQFKKLNSKQKQQFPQRLRLFVVNKNTAGLNNHALKGRYSGYRSINISGDLRAIYMEHSSAHIEFLYIGTHSQLYK